jgi:NADH-quinone oxidoreductase subunit C
MTEQDPQAAAPTPEAAPEAASADATAPKDAAAPAEKPAHRGPPIVIAEEVLNDRGQETAAQLASVLGALSLEAAGREDTPWARVEAKQLHEAAQKCRDGVMAMDMLNLMLAVDWVDRIQMIYVLYSTTNNRKAILKADLPADSPSIDSVTDLWEAATWYERETHDLFGVEFPGNADMSPLLLYEGFEGHPGLKSYPLNDYEEW